MDISITAHRGEQIALITAENGEIKSADTIVRLMDDIKHKHHADKMLADRGLIDESFFDLRSGFLVTLSEAFATHRLNLAITGDFSFVENLAIKAYLAKHGLGKAVRFARNREEGLDWLSLT